MSKSRTTSSDSNKPESSSRQYKKPALNWSLLSVAVSGLILGWGVSLPFSKRDDSLLTKRKNLQHENAADEERRTLKFGTNRITPEQQEFVDHLMAEDERMLKRARMRSEPKILPRKDHKEIRNTRIESMQKQVDLLSKDEGAAVEGTVQWQAMRDMEKVMDDFRQGE